MILEKFGGEMYRSSTPPRVPTAAVLALALAAGWGHVGYPAWLWWRTRGQPDAAPPPAGDLPGITAVVAAYRERSVIAAKVQDLRANGYEGPLDIIVVADDQETADAARATGVEVIQPSERRGKCAAVNTGIQAAQQPIVVLSDANAMLQPGSLAALARWFADPTVGAVAGEKRAGGAASGEGWFWRFESWLKRRESRTGTTIGLVGELAALRRDAVKTLPTNIIVDDLWLALDMVEGGHRIAYEPAASTTEEVDWSLRADWERRTRNVSGALDVLLRRRSLLGPGSPVAGQLWGHRLVRFTVGPLAHLVLLLLALGRMRRSRLATLFVSGHLAAAGALARTRSGRASGLERLLGQTLWLQLVGLGGLLRFLRKDRPAIWPKEER